MHKSELFLSWWMGGWITEGHILLVYMVNIIYTSDRPQNDTDNSSGLCIDVIAGFLFRLGECEYVLLEKCQ